MADVELDPIRAKAADTLETSGQATFKNAAKVTSANKVLKTTKVLV